ncbi:MAG TPA: carboxylating nicotinate-nucleotide diphosphorylase [Candidatus Deferrimicrobium sp.]|nr:carboxylating nicotinate-nucleotide diphosphorylase [Candidatus Deferrimicrobium sp.]
MELPDTILRKKIKEFLEEDIGFGDITTNSIIKGTGSNRKASIFTRRDGIVAGLKEIVILFDFFHVKTHANKEDGTRIQANEIIMELEGPVKGILAGERTALNLLMRMSGIATTTFNIVEKVRQVNPSVKIACTRKTTPGFRYFEKKAVKLGMGDTHRYRLDDMVLIKDNHLKLIPDIPQIIKLVRESVGFSKKIEIEVTSVEQALEAAKAKVDILMLDNFKVSEVQRAIDALEQNNLRENVFLEVSGNITPENILNYANLRVDVISLGYLTHSIKALDISLDLK